MIGFALVRYKEVKGYYPGLKSYSERKALKQQEKEQAAALKDHKGSVPSGSPGSSQMFEGAGKSSTEKTVEAVREVPTRTISD
jgi:hypothetical protein